MSLHPGISLYKKATSSSSRISMKWLDFLINNGTLPECTMVRLFFLLGLLFVLLPHNAATAPKVSAKIVREAESNEKEDTTMWVKEGQAAYVDWGRRIREVMIKCKLPSNVLYTKYEVYRRANNETQGTLVHSGTPETDGTGKYFMDTFRAGGYWCVGEGENGETSPSNLVYLGTRPNVRLKQMEPFPEEGGTARFVCEIEDDLTSFNIDRKVDYQCNCSGYRHDISSVPGGDWQANGTKLEITNVTKDWAMDARPLCRVIGLTVRDSTAGDFDPSGYFYSSEPVAIMFAEPTVITVTTNHVILNLEPSHIAAIVIGGGIALLALALVALALLVVVVVRKRSQTQPAAVDPEHGPPNDAQLGLGPALGEGRRRTAPEDLGPAALLPPSVPGHAVQTLPGACDACGHEQWQQARGYS